MPPAHGVGNDGAQFILHRRTSAVRFPSRHWLGLSASVARVVPSSEHWAPTGHGTHRTDALTFGSAVVRRTMWLFGSSMKFTSHTQP